MSSQFCVQPFPLVLLSSWIISPLITPTPSKASSKRGVPDYSFHPPIHPICHLSKTLLPKSSKPYLVCVPRLWPSSLRPSTMPCHPSRPSTPLVSLFRPAFST